MKHTQTTKTYIRILGMKKRGKRGEKRTSLLEKVVSDGLLGRSAALILRSGVEDGEVFVELFVELQDGSYVAAAVAVVRGGPNGKHGLVEVPLVALHDELMRAAYQLDAVRLVELRDHVRAEQVAGASWTHAPTDYLLWV